MTVAQLHPLTRRLFANLPPAAKAEFRAWVRNLLQSFCFPGVPRADQQAAIDNALREMRELLQDPEDANHCHVGRVSDHNAHLGTAGRE
jgi:hypothetical protein